MTYENVVRRGWFCKCKSHSPQDPGLDTWMDWKLCGRCRLPIQESRHPSAGKQGYPNKA